MASLSYDCQHNFREESMTLAYYNFGLIHYVWREEQEILIPSSTYVGEVPLYMSSHEFFEDGLKNLRMKFPQPAIPDALLEMIMQEMASPITRFVEICRQNCYALWPNAPSSTLHVDLDLVINSLMHENEAVDNSALNQNEAPDVVLMESMNEISMVPACQEAIGSLKPLGISTARNENSSSSKFFSLQAAVSSLTIPFCTKMASLSYDCQHNFREESMTLAYYNFGLIHYVWREEQEILIPSSTYVGEVPLYMSSHEFFEDGLKNLRMKFPQPAIPDALLEMIMQEMASPITRFVEICRQNCYALWPNAPSSTLHVDLDLVINSLMHENEAVDNSALNQNEAPDVVLMESMNEISMVPACQEAIGSLKNPILEIKDYQTDRRICLEEFGDGTDVSAMPCGRIYHQQCIGQWLETSHVRPLCRYEMPV